MLADVAEEAGFDFARHEAPYTVVTFETVDVPPGDDRLQRQTRQFLVDRKVANRADGRLGRDVDDDVRDRMPGTRSVVDVVLEVQTPIVGSGIYATHANVPASALVKSIAGTTAIEEAAVWMAGLQAYNLITKVPVGAGDAVLVTAGTSPVGSALIQFARDMGATVFATTRTDARKQELLDLGAHHVIATDGQALSDVVLEVTGGKGVKVVLDTVGGTLLAQCVACLAEGGSLFSYGAQTSPDITTARVDVPLVALDRRSLSFVDLFELTDVPERFAVAQEYIRDAVARAVFKPRVDSTFRLADVQEAHRRMEDRVLNGKVVITTS